MYNYLAGLRTDVWRTSGARYNAARRLRRRENVSVFSLALFSAMSGALPFFQRVYAEPGSSLDNYLTTFAAALGIFLLAISLIEWGAKTGALAEALHKNAEQLNGLRRAVELKLAVSASSGNDVTEAEATQLSEMYEHVKDSCVHNHLPIDDRCFLSAKRFSPEFTGASGEPRIGLISAALSRTTWYMTSLWFFAVLWSIVLAGLLFAFSVDATAPDKGGSTAAAALASNQLMGPKF